MAVGARIGGFGEQRCRGRDLVADRARRRPGGGLVVGRCIAGLVLRRAASADRLVDGNRRRQRGQVDRRPVILEPDLRADFLDVARNLSNFEAAKIEGHVAA
ncbi:hypothetical protein FQZ97_754780 [compost metagenome]